MNREIKFRVWDEKIKHFFYFDLIDSHIKKEFTLLEWSEMPKEQFTGLKDKNGKEICEGDIMKYPTDTFADIGKIVWEHNAFILLFDYVAINKNFRDDFERGEVIGNIYENPELLE